MPARDVCAACGYPAVSGGRCWACGARDAAAGPHVVDGTAERAKRERSGRAARDIWHRAKPATRSIVETYFALRGLPAVLADLPALRFTWACHHPGGFKLPTLLAVVSDATGQPCAVHRTFLQPDGSGKAPVEPQKATLGACWGGAVVLIGDYAGHSRNPDEWRSAISAIAWARSAIIHGTGAQAWHYREGIRAAVVTGRCLFIETDSRHAPAWAAAVLPRGIPSLKIIPPNGGVHPAEQARSELQ